MTDTKDVAKEAASVGQGVAEAGQHVAGVAKEQTSQVTAEAGRQAKDLLSQAQGGLKEQAGVQQQKLVSGLQALRDELNSMVSGNNNPGVATDLARQAADRTGSAATWLDGRDPAAVLDDLTAFARRRPGVFLAAAAGIGLLAGRLTRGLKAQSDAPDTSASRPAVSAPPVTAPPITTPPITAPTLGAPALDGPGELPRTSAVGF
jgi:hypothetical protein